MYYTALVRSQPATSYPIHGGSGPMAAKMPLPTTWGQREFTRAVFVNQLTTMAST